MIFENNRKIMERCIKGKLGAIAHGRYADIIIAGYSGPMPVSAETIDSHVLFGMNSRHIDTVIINGKIIMKDKVMPHIDEESLLAKSREHAQKLWQRI